MCRSKHDEQLINIGIINSTTRSHLVGYFYKIYVMMHGSMNIKSIFIQNENIFGVTEGGTYNTTGLQMVTNTLNHNDHKTVL